MCDCVSYYSRLPVELFISLSLALGCGNFVPLRDYDHFNYETAFIHFGAGRQAGRTHRKARRKHKSFKQRRFTGSSIVVGPANVSLPHLLLKFWVF